MGIFDKFFNKIKNTGQISSELIILQRNIMKNFKEFQKEIKAEDKEEIEITKENESQILLAMSKFIKDSIKEVDKLKSLNFEQKQIAKEQIIQKLTKEFKKKIDYFKNKKPKEIRKLLKL